MPQFGEDDSERLGYDAVAEHVEQALEEASGVSVQTRILIYELLLSVSGLEPLAASQISPELHLRRALRSDAYRKLLSSTEAFKRDFAAVIKPTYLVANYWSPIDGRRRAVVASQSGDSAIEREKLAWTYGQFALSHSGDRLESPLWSLVHYVAAVARRKRPFVVTYLDHGDESPEGQDEISIPAFVQTAILEELGLSNLVRAVLLPEGVSTTTLENETRKILRNEPGSPWRDIDDFSQQAIDRFRGCLAGTSRAVRDFIERVRRRLASRYEDALTIDQAAFAVALHVMWQRAFPSKHMYGFPVSVGRTCCILTVGTERPLTEKQASSLRDVAHSLFIYPLFSDTATRRVRTVLHEARRSVSSISSQCTIAVRDIERETDVDRLRPSILARLRTIDGDAKALSALFSRVSQTRNIERKTIEWIPVEEFVRAAYTPLAEGFERIGARVKIPSSKHLIQADRLDMLALFGNLFENALYWLEEVPVHQRLVEVTVRTHEDAVEVVVADTGPGVPLPAESLIFRPYYTTRPGGGGVGLSVVTDVCAEYRGSVELLKGRKERGAAFRVLLRDYDEENKNE